MFILSENTLLHGVRGFGCRCSRQVVPTRSVRFLRAFDHYTEPVTLLSCSHLSISECSKPMGLKSKCSLAQFSCILEANGSSTQILLNIRLKQERHKRCKPWISGYLIILALNIWSATPFSSSIYVSWMLMSMLRWSISHLRNSSSINISFDAVSEMAWCSTERKPVISSARLPATTLSLPGRSPPESLKGVPPWMQSLGKDTGDLVPLVPLTLTYKFISLTSYQFWNLLQLCMLPEFPGKWISFVHVGEVHLLFSVWSASCFS